MSSVLNTRCSINRESVAGVAMAVSDVLLSEVTSEFAEESASLEVEDAVSYTHLTLPTNSRV